MTALPPKVRLAIGSGVGLLLLLFFLSQNKSDIQQISGYTMGTSYQIQLVDIPENLTLNGIQQDINEILVRLDRGIFSTYAPDSEVSRFNRSAPDSIVSISPELAEVVALSGQVSEMSSGAFDVTVGPLVNLWGFGPPVADTDIPTEMAIERVMRRVGYQKVILDTDRATLGKTGAIEIDLSGIAKGYAVDQVAGYIESLGISDYFLEIGGELKMSGYKPGELSWIPALERPVNEAPQVFDILDSRGERFALAGSGDYRNFYEVDGMRFSHEIDPRTGRPITHNLAAVYVIDESAARADGLATALMVLGYEQGMKLARELELAVYFIVRSPDDGFDAHYTELFSRYLDTQE